MEGKLVFNSKRGVKRCLTDNVSYSKNILNDTEKYYKVISEGRTLRGRMKTIAVAQALHFAKKDLKEDNFGDIAERFKLTKYEIKKHYENFQSIVNRNNFDTIIVYNYENNIFKIIGKDIINMIREYL